MKASKRSAEEFWNHVLRKEDQILVCLHIQIDVEGINLCHLSWQHLQKVSGHDDSSCVRRGKRSKVCESLC